jgi:hypothetical protein
MHLNVARAYDALWAEYERIRGIHMKILSQGDPNLERRLLRANPDNSRHQNEVLLYEERLSRPQRRRKRKLHAYGRKIEQLMETLLRLFQGAVLLGILCQQGQPPPSWSRRRRAFAVPGSFWRLQNETRFVFSEESKTIFVLERHISPGQTQIR